MWLSQIERVKLFLTVVVPMNSFFFLAVSVVYFYVPKQDWNFLDWYSVLSLAYEEESYNFICLS